jgi:hypothetical protein
VSGYTLTVERMVARKRIGSVVLFECPECAGEASSTCDCFLDALQAARENEHTSNRIARNGAVLAFNVVSYRESVTP